MGGVGPGEGENANPEESEDVLALADATGPLLVAPDGRTLRVQAVAEHLDQMIHLRAEAWCPVQVFRLERLEPRLLLDVTEGRRELNDAVLDGRECPLPAILAVGYRKLFRPGAELGDPRFVDLLTEDARVRQRSDIGNDVLQAIFDRLPPDLLGGGREVYFDRFQGQHSLFSVIWPFARSATLPALGDLEILVVEGYAGAFKRRCIVSEAKIGPDNDKSPGGCDNVVVTIQPSGSAAAAYNRSAD